MYALILTIVPENGTPVVHTITGFRTRADADITGANWRDSHVQLADRGRHSFEYVSAYMG